MSTVLEVLCEKNPNPDENTEITTNRKRAKSDILGGSAYKLTVEEFLASKKVLNNVPRNSPERAKKPFKVPEKLPKKKVWRCPACTEIYVDYPHKTGWMFTIPRMVA
ncbi:hypothetical protein WA026_008074 [Henosepilachna vigintioctopunctata]|uniref:Uncharacterized protein n=1 Tax=Henosepilachna vigintioctopunctata TaxID=420089 RepID=A0AAW1TQV3_9CUCU